MACKHAKMHRSTNIREEVPVCRKNKTYCKKVKFIPTQGLINFIIKEEYCSLENT